MTKQMAKAVRQKASRANANFCFDNTLRSSISVDLFEQFSDCGTLPGNGKSSPTGFVLVSVQLPEYAPFQKSILLSCTLNRELRLGSIELSSNVFHVERCVPAIDTCTLQHYVGNVPSLSQMVIAVHPGLYEQLGKLPSARDRMRFVMAKSGLDEHTIIHRGDTLLEKWCCVLDCGPYFQGKLDLSSTNVVFIKTESPFLCSSAGSQVPALKDLQLSKSERTIVSLRALDFPVSHDAIRPRPLENEDDSLFVFAHASTFLKLGLTGGSLVKITFDGISRVAKAMVFLAPHKYESGFLYVSPRLLALFKSFGVAYIEPSSLSLKDFPVASSLSLARVGSWNNGQKIFESIISRNLIKFLTGKNRILKSGDLLPVSFDSQLSPFFHDGVDEIDLQGKHDSIVWFRVETVDLENSKNYTHEFRIDGKKTTLFTQNLVSEAPLSLSQCNYLSYFGLPSVFEYDLGSFSYAKRFVDILKVGLKNRSQKKLPPASVILQSSSPCAGKSTLVRFASLHLGAHLIEIDCLSINSAQSSVDAMNNVVGFLRAKLEPLLPFTSPSIVFLSHLDSIVEKEGDQQDSGVSRLNRSLALELAALMDFCSECGEGAIFVGSVKDAAKLPEAVLSKVQFVIDVPVPSEVQRERIFEWYLESRELNSSTVNPIRFSSGYDVVVSKLAQRSAGLSPNDIKSIVQTAKTRALERNLSSESFFDEYACSGDFVIISQADLIAAIEVARDEFSDTIGAPKIPNVDWNDIGGMDIVKGEIMDTIDLPLKHPELFSSGMKKRSGILFYGPPGTGKTLLAKAIATNFSLNFFSVKGPELLNMYIGESEANVRRVFQKARDAKPCVVFFDELDSVAPKRGNQGDSGGVMDRIVSQLLAELDGMSTGGDGVFVIGATNRPDLLDEALLRPGRFDKLLYLGISDTNEKQENILRALSRKFTLHHDVDFSKLAEICPFNYTGADFYALCSDSMLNAMTRVSKEVDKKVADYCKAHDRTVSVRYWFDKVATEGDAKVVVKMQDFLKAQKELSPSVSQEELNHYLSVKRNFEGI
ncbi:AAA family ATPase peroxin 6 [Lachancea thermotolerans CBS 6340]|uniref:Peroxisomal ATPase PEX6 n=1 Tax=Lachancea thermotolerans (strain ATCC 56472 / CBS 6340 / NRRL Y-8284) TaxID=559295 RepID=C5DJW5_LACTC|nr:KLTH0F19646p [Lachancea thermotolerans CBS 6340]CAR24604.1 KLTH0F19646p [Lachancea thermotolerans CBS 6340]